MDYFTEEIVDIADDGSNGWMQREARNGSVTVLNDEHVCRSGAVVDGAHGSAADPGIVA
jgi:hypothetical protein